MKTLQYNKKCKLIWTPVDSIERRSSLSYKEFIREYASVRKPVIITDVMENWKASTKWTMDFFKSEYGSITEVVIDCNAETSLKSRTYVSMTIADYIDYVTSGDQKKLLYLSRFCICDHPELWDDYQDPIYFNNWYKKFPLEILRKYMRYSFYLLIGQKDTSIGLHYDTENDTAWVAVISGRKQIVLFSPDQEKYLYDGQVDSFNPDLEKFPLYANAKPVECILNQGEMIHIPSKWWHQVKNLENTISLAINSLNEWNYELVCQHFLEQDPIKGHLFPLILKFPLLGKALFTVGLL